MALLLSLFGDRMYFKERHMNAKLTRSGLVMVNFVSTWLGHGVPDISINIILGVFVKVFHLHLEKADCPLQSM